MKKRIFWKIGIIIIVLACVLVPLIFLLPQKPATVQLSTPTDCTITVLETGRIQISSPENDDASKYIFGICDNADFNTDANYFVKLESDTNVLDITDYLPVVKTYYFYAQYGGSGSFTTSLQTDTKTYNNSVQLATPTLQISDTDLSWTPISDAVSYTLYSNNIAVSTAAATTYNFDSLLSEGVALSFQVRANGNVLHPSSSKSNEVKYTSHVQLATPSNLQISGVGSELKLTWNAVAHASKYTVQINGTQEVIVSTNQLSLAAHLSQFGDYYFKVKTNDNDNYLGSVYSAPSETYTKTGVLSTPTGLNAVKNNQFVEISWNAVEGVNSYTLKINGQEITNITQTTYSINTTILLPVNGLIYDIQVKAIGVGYMQSSGYSASYIYRNVAKFSAPSNITVSKVEDVITVNWTAVTNALSYTVLIDDTLEIATDNNSADISEYCPDPQSYNIQVKVNANVEEQIFASDYSMVLEYRNIVEIAAPTGLTVVSDGAQLNFNFEAPEHSANFTIYANQTKLSEEITVENRVINLNTLPTSNNNKYVFRIYANENGYYGQSQSTSSIEYVLLASPDNFHGEKSDTSISLLWHLVANATGYDIYVNDIFIVTKNSSTTSATINIGIGEGEIAIAESYSAKIYATSSNSAYLTSAPSIVADIADSEPRAIPTNVAVSGTTGTARTVSWNAVPGAYGYNVVINNNSPIVVTALSLDLSAHLEENKVYSIRVKARGDVAEKDSAYSTGIMINTSANTLNGYSNQYFYLNGWNDYVIENNDELDKIVTYLAFKRATSIQFYVNYDSSVSNLDKFKDSLDRIMETGGVYQYAYQIISPNVFKVFNITYYDTQGGADTINKQTIANIEEEGYSQNTKLTPKIAPAQTRAIDFNDFAIENSAIEVLVSNSNELYKAIEGGAKPIIASTNIHLLNVYNTAKDILREIISDDMTEFQKATAIFDWIIYNCYYDYITYEDSDATTGYNCYYLEGVLLDKVAVCDGFSKAYAMLCGMEGIKCVKVGGDVKTGVLDADNNPIWGAHAWNKIYLNLDGQYRWYGVDITWSNRRVDKEEFLSHKYFLVSDDVLNAEHLAVGYNPATSGTMNYYKAQKYSENKDYYIENNTELNSLVDYMIANMATALNLPGVKGFEYYYTGENYSNALGSAVHGRVAYTSTSKDGVITVFFIYE